MLGLYRKYTTKSNGEMIVREGSDQHYRTIDSKGNVKWWHGNTVISDVNQKSECNGLIQNITNPKPILFPYGASDDSADLNLNAASYFKNANPELCPLTNCSLY